MEAVDRIKDLKIHGSRLISIIGLRTLREEALANKSLSKIGFLRHLLFVAKKISDSRKDEHALRNVLSFVLYDVYHSQSQDVHELKEIIFQRSLELEEDLQKVHDRVAKIAVQRIPEYSKILTHSFSSSVVESLKRAHDLNKKISVVCCESRPTNQGIRMAKELSSYGIPTSLIVDSAARKFMRQVDLVLLGADAISSNGTIVNKIGAASIAALAREQGKPLLVVSGSYKFNPVTVEGFHEPTDERNPEEIIEQKLVPKVKIKNPAFEAVPPQYVDAIITELGIVSPKNIFGLMSKKFEWLGKDHSILKNLL